ncbi:MAG: prepilin peptidase [Acidobacteria bacterium]|nr:prepilin peptidase [Acidobacteriota bacterium]
MEQAFWIPALATAVIAAGVDARTRRIPNWLSVPSMVAGLVAAGMRSGSDGLWQSLLSVGIAVLFFGMQCWMGSMGMGDLKLGCALGAWIAPEAMVFALMVAAMAAGLHAVVYSLLRYPSGSIPYGPAMAAGVIVSMFAHWR